MSSTQEVAMEKTNQAVETVPKLMDLLIGLTPEERGRAIKAALVLLGDTGTIHENVGTGRPQDVGSTGGEGICGKAASWMKKEGITRDQLDHVFLIEPEGAEVIGKMPGNSKRQQTVEAYVLCGLRAFLKDGSFGFTDKEARELCKKVGCYDSPNHYNYKKGFGNYISGNQQSGWKLTNPGLSHAATIVKSVAPASENNQ